MTTIEAYNYTIGLDTSRLESGGIVTRRELSAIRRDFVSLQSPADKARLQIERLNDGFQKGAITKGDYHTALSRLTDRINDYNASLPAAVAETQRLESAERDAAAIKRGLASDSELYGAEVRRLAGLVRDTGLSHAEARRHLASFRSELPEARREARQLADAEREADAVRRSLASESGRFAAEQSRLNRLVRSGALSQRDANAAIARYRSQMPSVLNSQRSAADLAARGEAAQRRYATATERVTHELRKEREELDLLKARGAIDSRTHQRGIDSINRRQQGGGVLQSAGAARVIGGAGFAAAAAGVFGILQGIQRSLQEQRTEEGFAGLAGGREQAALLMQDIRELQSLGLDGGKLGDVSAQFLAGGMQVSEIKETLEMIGNVARGDDERFGRLAIAFGQVRDAGRLTGEDLNQLRDAGFNPLTQMSERTGESMSSLRDKMSDGLITFEAVRNEFVLATAEGGRLHNQLEAVQDEYSQISQSTGRLFTQFGGALTAIGRVPSGFIGEFLQSTADSIDRFSSVGFGAQGTIGRGLIESFLPEGWAAELTAAADHAERIRDEAEADAELKRQADAEESERAKLAAAIAAENVVNAKNRQAVEKTLGDLRDRANAHLVVQAQEEQKILETRHATIDELAEMERLHAQIAEHERSEAVAAASGDTAGQIEQLREELRLRQAVESIGLGGSVEALAKMSIAGATNTELNKEIKLRRELADLQFQGEAIERQQQEFERLKSEAESLRDSLRTPAETLAETFSDRADMVRLGLLSIGEAARANAESLRSSTPEVDAGVNAGGIESTFGLVVAEQQARRREQLQIAEERRLIASVNRVAQAEGRRQQNQVAITAQMQRQVELSNQIVSASPPQFNQSSQTDRSVEYLERIAVATEGTTETVQQWDLVAV